jgi:hypothetical protein
MSKLLTLVLRHHPGRIGIALDSNGRVAVPDLLKALDAHGTALTRDRLAAIVAGSDKQRFAIDEATDRIRANQGHRVGVDLGLTQSGIGPWPPAGWPRRRAAGPRHASLTPTRCCASGSSRSCARPVARVLPQEHRDHRRPDPYHDMVAAELNNRPRRILDYRTPAEVFTDLLASTIASTG